MMQNLIDQFQLNFIDGDRWKLLLSGLGTTLLITFFAVILGIVLGFLVAVVRSAHDTTGKLKILNVIAQIYTTVIRGTPVLVQLMIIYYVVFASVNISKIFVAVLAFGLNSGAYVSEIVRSGIMSVDRGQMEAGRSLGFSYSRTMLYVILPQAFKNVLPALGNEFITLLKETSVSGYIAVSDLTKAGDIIRSRTFSAFMPLIAVALIYLFFVLIFTKLVSILERRLRESDH
ncbi:MAG: amino acid ABC transporter permease [Lachnospiraceae bacterium]|jgi:His/Glu/Gln/Arg/opine family amino acid ABC transporter permease subunit|nr:amino acid ABC transporter permease [Lachnospiraceae bacterium]MCI1727347.1 amino acid ABC transporter permease [Lachnospiraceae bacterium]